jgi:N-acetylglucosaminyl-diphospho-decaprenol L-rhamnosyltransferase
VTAPLLDVAAVVVNYCTASLTAGCVSSLRADGVADVVVVDASSDDLTAVDARVVRLASNRGYGAGANAGVATTSAPSVIVCNPDLTVSPGTVAALLSALDRDPGLGAVGPRIDRPDGSRYPSARAFPSLTDSLGHGFVGLVTQDNPWSRRYLRPDALAAGPVDWVSGAFMVIRRAAFEAIGGFDEAYFMFMEDVDLCQRLHDAGWGVAYEPAGRVVHLEGASRAVAPYRMILAHHRSLLRYGWRTAGLRERALMPVIAAGLGVRAAAMCARAAFRRA